LFTVIFRLLAFGLCPHILLLTA